MASGLREAVEKGFYPLTTSYTWDQVMQLRPKGAGCQLGKSRGGFCHDKIELLSIFQALIVADHGNISHAADILGVRQSAISRRIQALEDELCVSLFERQLSGVRPTIAGQRFFERTRAALAEIDSAIKNAAAAGRGAEG